VLSALMADPSAWTYVEMPEVVRRARGHAELAAGFAAAAPLGRLAQPIEIARTILFLACDESAFTTGAEFVVDGGLTAA